MGTSQNNSITMIKDLKPGMSGLNLNVIALDIGRVTITKDQQEVRTIKVADKTGMVNLSLWNEPGKVLQSGDIIRISRAYTGMFKTCLTVQTAKQGDFFKIGEFCMVFNEVPNMSESNPELAAQFEQEEIERKAAKEAARNGNNAGAGGGSRGSGSGKTTWGTQGTASSTGRGSSSGSGNGGRGSSSQQSMGGGGGSNRGSQHSLGRGGAGQSSMGQMGGSNNGGRGQHRSNSKEKR